MVDALEEHFGIVPIVIVDKINALERRELLKSRLKQAIRCKDIEEFRRMLEQTRRFTRYDLGFAIVAP